MSIFATLFGGAQPAAPVTPVTPGVTAPNAGAPTPGNIPAAAPMGSAATPGAAANGLVPPGTSTTDVAKSPLDAFSDFWKNDTTNTTAAQPLFNATKEDMMKAAANADFRSVLKPEQLQAIAQGGEAATAAFSEALNAVAQQVYAQSAFAATKLIESGINRHSANFKNELPGIIKTHAVGDSLRTENAALNHPAVQPIADALKSQLVVKFPNATTAELNQMANQYLSAMATAIAPAQNAQATGGTQAKTAEPDWSTFL